MSDQNISFDILIDQKFKITLDYDISRAAKTLSCTDCMPAVFNPNINKASQAIQSPRTVLFFLLISLLDGYSFANVHVKGIVAFKH